MRTLLTWTAAATAVVLAGCAQTKSGTETPTPRADRCEFAETKANTCTARGERTVCNIYVGEIAGRTHVYPYTLRVPLQATKVVVVWHLQVPGARFVKGGGDEDGPKWALGTSSSEFEAGEPTQDPDGAQQGRPEGLRYRITFKNSPTGAGPHGYVIQYRKGTKIMRCDPFIVSEGGG